MIKLARLKKMVFFVNTIILLISISFIGEAVQAMIKQSPKLTHVFLRTQSLDLKQDWRFQFDHPVNYHIFWMKSPYRLVIDFKKAYLSKASKAWLDKQAHQNILSYSVSKDRLRIVWKTKKKPIFKLISPKTLSLKGKADLIYLERLGEASHNKWYEIDSYFNKKSMLKKKRKPWVIMIDPGHGGKDPGAVGLRGVKEKVIVLAMAKKLQNLLNQKSQFRAFLTRSSDIFLNLRSRLRKARNVRADLFIAIHADAYFHRYATGVSVYALSSKGVSSEAARWLAMKENHSELLGGADLSLHSAMVNSVLINLQQTASIRSSLKLGKAILEALGRIAPLHHQEVEQAAFVVLKSPDIPSLLIETGFLSNPYEERKLVSKYYQNKLAKAILKGIEDFYHLSTD